LFAGRPTNHEAAIRAYAGARGIARQARADNSRAREPISDQVDYRGVKIGMVGGQPVEVVYSLPANRGMLIQLPGHNPTLTKKQTRRATRRRFRNKLLYMEVVNAAADLGIELGPEIKSIPDAVMTIFRRTHALWLHAASQVDRLDPEADPGVEDSLWTLRYDENGNRIIELSKWIQYEQALRSELFEQAMQMSHLKLDERMVQVEETTLAILGRALQAAMQKAQVPEDLRKTIGSNLRTELAIIDGNAEEVAA
jgi:hypothetical protein